MAFPFRGAPSPRDDPHVAVYASAAHHPLSPPRHASRVSAHHGPATGADVRSGLTRRFTTNALPSLSPMGQQRKHAAGDYASAGYARKTPSETAARTYEMLLAKQRELQAQIDSFDPRTRLEVEENLRHEHAITQMMAASEPASPPDYAHVFPTAFSKPNRYSIASVASPPGIATRPNRSSTQLTSPSAGFARPYTSGPAAQPLPSQSVPGSRRQSDDEEDDADDSPFIYGLDHSGHRAAANPNRNSMPITGYDRKRNTADLSSLGPVNTTSFLFDDDDENPPVPSASSATSPPNKHNRLSLQVGQTADGFPKLIRADQTISDLSSSAALDLALAHGVEPQPQSQPAPPSSQPQPQQQQQQPSSERATAGSRNRISLPPSALSNSVSIAPLNSILANADSKSAVANHRRSLEVKFSAETKRPPLMASPPRGMANGGFASTSYSTNDIPTLKSINGDAANGGPVTSPPVQAHQATESTSSEISTPLTAATSTPASLNRQSRDFAAASKAEDSHGDPFPSGQPGLQANAAPFGPTSNASENPSLGQNGVSPYAPPAYFGGGNYNVPVHMLSNGFNGMNLHGAGYAGLPQWQNQSNAYGQQQQGGYGGYGQFGPGGQAATAGAGAGAGRFGDTQRQTMQQRRQAQEEAYARYNSVNIEDLVGEIYGLCKDQYGCRFLQRKLDERNEKVIQTIFDEVKDHIIELMTDPFGNYLCQKLLESTNDEQRTALIRNAMPAMNKIALNQHGTRALQKMIEFISTPEQTQMIIEALRFDVVQLIQDLNGNHVIQKCLNHLSPHDAQFIFDAVGANCITVGTHRHGCCVLQRCIDHASGAQKGALVDQVIKNAFALVQDPFGNYVVQYILDLADPRFTEPLCQSFFGNIAFLSKQKFSSNVVEKCIRCASDETKRVLVQEIVVPPELERLLRDSFANYVVQTAMDFADDESKTLLVENIRPILPSIRHTPYGRRIQSKISEHDGRSSGLPSGVSSAVPSGVATPAEMMSPASGSAAAAAANPAAALAYAVQSTPAGRSNRQGFVGPPPQWSGGSVPGASAAAPAAFTNGNGHFSPPNGFAANHSTPNGTPGEIASPTPQRHSHGSNTWFGGEGPSLTNFANPSFNNGMGSQGPPAYGGRF